MKKFFLIAILTLSGQLLAKSNTYLCNVILGAEDNIDYLLTIEETNYQYFLKGQKIIHWTSNDDESSSIQFPFPKIKENPHIQNETTKGREFMKSTKNAIFTNDQLFIDNKILQNGDEGIVYRYEEPVLKGHQIKTLNTTFSCRRQ